MGGERGRLFVRADADSQMGTGHLMRCLALAQAWRAEGGEVTFLSRCESGRLSERITAEGFGLHDIERSYPDAADWAVTRAVLAEADGAWLVLDGYHFGPEYHRLAKDSGCRLLVIDDMAHLDHYHADALLNQNIYAGDLDYVCDPDTLLLLGTEYALLRSEFLEWQGWRRETPDVATKVLITLGGADPANVSLKAIQALGRPAFQELEIVVVAGASNEQWEALASAAGSAAASIELRSDVRDMAELMAWADVAVSAAGSTCWELAFMGLPAVVLVVAENQELVAEGVERAGFGVDLGWFDDASDVAIADALETLIGDAVRRRRMAEAGRACVDGRGAARVRAALREVAHGPCSHR